MTTSILVTSWDNQGAPLLGGNCLRLYLLGLPLHRAFGKPRTATAIHVKHVTRKLPIIWLETAYCHKSHDLQPTSSKRPPDACQIDDKARRHSVDPPHSFENLIPGKINWHLDLISFRLDLTRQCCQGAGDILSKETLPFLLSVLFVEGSLFKPLQASGRDFLLCFGS